MDVRERVATGRDHVDLRSRWYTAIGIGGIAAAFIAGFVLPLPYRLATFHPWLTGDWVIDYSAGFVRRGLFGTLLDLVNPDAVQAIGLIAAIQFLLAAALFTIVAILFWRTSRSPAWIMLVLSPAFLLFPALDPDASARKELIPLVALAVVALGFSLNRVRQAALIALPIYVLGVFSHEVAVVMLPAFLVLMLIQNAERTRSAVTIAVAYVVVGVVGLITALAARGTTQVTNQLCARWLERGGPSCDGAITFLSQTPREAQQYLVAELFPAYWAYILTAALAFLPFILLRFLPGQWIIALAVVAAAAPLFVVSWDYGRWIYLITAQLSLIALALARTDRVRPMRVPLVVALAFILLWGMEHVSHAFAPGVLSRFIDSLF